MAADEPFDSRVKAFRQRQGWSQDELARRAGISRAAVSAIEIQRIVPSVAAALALAEALSCRVEDLFGPRQKDSEPVWAWPAAGERCRYWQAQVRGRTLRFPVEYPASAVQPHDGILDEGHPRSSGESPPPETLVMAGCDPAAELVAQAYARRSGFRLLVIQRSSGAALELLRQGLVDIAGMHLAEAADPDGNLRAAHEALGDGYSLLRYASWEEGLAVAAGISARSVQRVLRSRCRWIGREQGSGARQCQDQVLGNRPPPRRTGRSHRAVADALRDGWADVGVCVRIVCEEAGLAFLPVREEAYDLCFPTVLEDDPRIRALVELLRVPSFRRSLAELPGYRPRLTGELVSVR
jgi:molybdate-binding protein/transcriptional regulator with XRE-family HTH domain